MSEQSDERTTRTKKTTRQLCVTTENRVILPNQSRTGAAEPDSAKRDNVILPPRGCLGGAPPVCVGTRNIETPQLWRAHTRTRGGST